MQINNFKEIGTIYICRNDSSPSHSIYMIIDKVKWNYSNIRKFTDYGKCEYKLCSLSNIAIADYYDIATEKDITLINPNSKLAKIIQENNKLTEQKERY